MSSATQNSSVVKLTNAAPTPLIKAHNKDVSKPVETSIAKEISSERLLASCCDCV